jgi:hypothetical protein
LQALKTEDVRAAQQNIGLRLKMSAVPVCIKAAQLRSAHGVDNVREWLEDDKNVYVGRKQRIFIHTGRAPPADLQTLPVGAFVDSRDRVVERFVLPQSVWHNPFQIDKSEPLADEHVRVVRQYEDYLAERLANDDDGKLRQQLYALRGKNLGCWCAPPLACHARALATLVNSLA